MSSELPICEFCFLLWGLMHVVAKLIPLCFMPLEVWRIINNVHLKRHLPVKTLALNQILLWFPLIYVFLFSTLWPLTFPYFEPTDPSPELLQVPTKNYLPISNLTTIKINYLPRIFLRYKTPITWYLDFCLHVFLNIFKWAVMVRPFGNQQRVEQNYIVLLKTCKWSSVEWVKLEAFPFRYHDFNFSNFHIDPLYMYRGSQVRFYLKLRVNT